MKKVILGGIFLVAVLAFASADAQFRLAGDIAGNSSRFPDVESLGSMFDSSAAPTYGGFHWEIILNRIGFGMHYLSYFNNSSSLGEDLDHWLLHMDSDLFLSYHLFGGGALIDPFIEMGYGLTGAFRTANYTEHWNLFDDGTAQSLAFYAQVSAGLAIDLKGFLIGARLGYRPKLSGELPGLDSEDAEVCRYQVSFFGGIALGGH